MDANTGELSPVDLNVTARLNDLLRTSFILIKHSGIYGFMSVAMFRPFNDGYMQLTYENGFRVIVPYDEPLILYVADSEEHYHGGRIETGWGISR